MTRHAHRRTPTRIVDDLGRYLRTETVGGIAMLAATVLALAWANSPWQDGYVALRDAHLRLPTLDLTVGEWVADGLLAVFFFVAGLELKRELVVGELRRLRTAMLPVFAAAGGMVVPGVLAFIATAGEPGADRAWAIPLATDIAFALAILAVTASALPSGVRVLLLSLAVVDDLGAILVIAVLFTASIDWVAMGAAVVLLVGYALLQRFRVQGTWTVAIYVPLALGVWYAVHASGVHATVAGVALGLLTRVRRDDGEETSPAGRLEHRLQPWSAGVVVPLFALSAAGITLTASGLSRFLQEPVAWGVVVGLVLGKPIGVTLGAAVSVRLGLARLPRGVRWRDVVALGVLAGVGFTVSLLIAELAFGEDRALTDAAKTAVLVASVVASLAAAVLLRRRVRDTRRRRAAAPPET